MSTREPQTHWQRPGKAKVGHLTRAEAVQHAGRLRDADLDDGKLMTFPSVYICRDCGYWHVGNAAK